MKTLLTHSIVLSLIVGTVATAEEVETKFLIPGKSIFKADFEDGKNPGKPNWQLRNSTWEVHDGVLRGVNAGGNGPFIRLHSKESGGVLPEDYILKFSFKTETAKDVPENQRRKIHPKYSIGHRFSFGHYAAKYQWRGEEGMDLAIGHGHALQDDRFHIEKGKWYHVTAEIRGNEILVWFKDGPAYYMQHDHFRNQLNRWEFFTHITEIGYLDNLQAWAPANRIHDDWGKTRSQIKSKHRTFVSSEHPTFSIEKTQKP